MLPQAADQQPADPQTWRQKGKGKMKVDGKAKGAKKGGPAFEGWCDNCGKWGQKAKQFWFGQQQTVATVGADKPAGTPPGLEAKGTIGHVSAEQQHDDDTSG